MAFLIGLLNKSKSFKSLWNFNQYKHTWFLFYFISHSKILGCDRLPPLKEISSPRFGEARKKDGFGILGGLPPLKETFVCSLGIGFIVSTSEIWLDTGSSLVPYVAPTFISNGWMSIHILASILPQGGLSITSLHCSASIQQWHLLNYFGYWRVILWVNHKTTLRWSHIFISSSLLTSLAAFHFMVSHLQR
jgi:hypothetical protein